MTKAPLIFDKAMQEARRYWRDRLEAASFDEHIALDHPRPRDGQQRLSRIEHRLDGGLHALLQRVTAGNAFLRYTCLLLGLKICCSKHSGLRPVTIFCPADPHAGPANLLPIGSDIDPRASFKTMLVATKELLAASYRRQNYPLSRMLFDIPEGNRPKRLHLIAALEEFNGPLPEEQSDIAVLFRNRENATEAVIRFDSFLYDESTLRQFFLSFGAILQSGLTDMTLPIADLAPDPAAAPGVQARCTMPAPASGDRPAGNASVSLRIEAQAAARPDLLAVAEGNRRTSYGRLNEQATALADTLAAAAVDLRKPVAILLDASTEFVVSMYGVLKAGGSFGPIRPLSTQQSLAEMLRAIGAECVICRQEHLSHLSQSAPELKHAVTVRPGGAAGDMSFLHVALNGSASQLAEPSSVSDGEARPACVLLSGRGDAPARPVQHLELLTLFDSLNDFYGIGPADRCVLTPSLGLCEQLYDTLGMLIAGGGIEIPDQSDATNTSQLAARLMSGTITVWDVPAPLMQNMLGKIAAISSSPGHPKGPRAILLPGEKQCSVLAARLRGLFPLARIGGLYAAPAVQLWTTVFPVGDGVATSGDAAVAQPIRGFEHRVVNRNGQPVPLLAKGELHVERMLEGEFTLTGLRAQRLDATRMRWLRGNDHSFMKYGCCVELTEIEAALCRHDQIRGAEVLTLEAGPGVGQQVAAFIVAEAAKVSAEAARDWLVLTGGVDLIPDRFFILDEFPLLADGSIDRENLVRRFLSTEERAAELQRGASDEIRARLKSSWQEILQVDDVDEHESFFTSGGNSLKATLLIARIRSEFDVDLSVQSFFRKPTLHAVAELVAAGAASSVAPEREPEVETVSREKYRVQISGDS